MKLLYILVVLVLLQSCGYKEREDRIYKREREG
jgi:hypothetical protein